MAAAGLSRATVRTYTNQLRALLRIAYSLGERPVGLLALFGDTALLGRALAHPTRLDGAGTFTGYALNGRRHAARRFAMHFDRELRALHGEAGEVLLDRALRTAFRRVGTTYRLPTPLARGRGGPALVPSELERLLALVGGQPGIAGPRDGAALLIMAETGCRITALRLLDAADCHAEPEGRLRLLVRAKGRREPAEYLLSGRASRALRDAVAAFNRAAPRLGIPDRIRLGSPGPVWRTPRGVVSGDHWRAVLRRACKEDGLPPLRPHDLRRTFATLAESRAGRYQAALAGGWDGTRTMDRHYINPRADLVDARLRRMSGQRPAPRSDNATTAAESGELAIG